ncbi:hypothetical protein QFZ33_001366 [Arthrobacter globiformis]|nr:hypothetical protein [Arthrobacter globiformis]MDQ0617342.1 hypothetical protein [Arthrobacter globiformis]
MNDGHQNVDVVKGIRPSIPKCTATSSGQVAAQGHQPLALKLRCWYQDQDLDALPDCLESRGNPHSSLTGTGDGFHDAAAGVRVPRLQRFLLPGIQKGIVVGGRHWRGRSRDGHLRQRRDRVGPGVG